LKESAASPSKNRRSRSRRAFFGKPTIINNVETFASVPVIIERGADWYSQFGTKDSKGTKVFALAGDVVNTGIVEVPIGMPLGDIIFEIGGGTGEKKKFKSAQIGGPSGGCVTTENLNVATDYETLKRVGAIMGSGGLIVMNEDTCMVDTARFFMDFIKDESCGKCVAGRIGTKRMLEILERITRGEGEEGDVELLIELGKTIQETAMCGLGQTAPNPVLSTIQYFRDEYDEHIRNKYCRAGVCSSLFISPCENTCPANVNVPGYMSLVAAGRFIDAYNLIRQENPFPRSAAASARAPARRNRRRRSCGRSARNLRFEAFRCGLCAAKRKKHLKTRHRISEKTVKVLRSSARALPASPAAITWRVSATKSMYSNRTIPRAACWPTVSRNTGFPRMCLRMRSALLSRPALRSILEPRSARTFPSKTSKPSMTASTLQRAPSCRRK
jgi:hypothetical protein